MKSFIEEYGLAILTTIIVIILIALLSPIKIQVKDVLVNIGEKEAFVLEKNNEYLKTEQIVQARVTMNQHRNNNESVKRNFSTLADTYMDAINNLETSSYFIAPIEDSNISAGVWHYPKSFGEGVHLGIDYAATLGTDIVAPANGVIIVSSNGCGTGFLGDSCAGNDPNAVNYGGNQIYFLTSVDNKVYCITFSHLLLNTAHAKGIVYQGDKIAEVGGSGNATGPHSHIEVFYLGEGDFQDVEETYMRTDYTASFNCGWGEAALGNICENTLEGSCRIDPTKIFTEE